MIFGTCKLHTTASGVMQILYKFCHNKHNTLDGDSDICCSLLLAGDDRDK